jgi:hypothetical protein
MQDSCVDPGEATWENTIVSSAEFQELEQLHGSNWTRVKFGAVCELKEGNYNLLNHFLICKI